MDSKITMVKGITIRRSMYDYPTIRIEQDHDLVALDDDYVEEFIAAIREHARIVGDACPTPDDGVARGMHAFFDRYVKFVRVARSRGVMDKDDRMALFAIYTSRME